MNIKGLTMIRNSLKISGGILITLFSLQIYADNKIRIIVKTNEKTAAAIGYSVEGITSGALGKFHAGKGSKNKVYKFGYRKHSILGVDIACGTLILTKDSTITLIAQGDKCLSVVTD